jgi:trigger factor
MTISVEKLPECKAKLSVEIPPSVVTQERDRIVASFAAQAKIPGFRPGKAPKSAVEKRYQKEILEELGGRLVSRACAQADKEEKLEILGIAEEEARTFGPDGSFAWAAQVVVAPEIKLSGYDAIPVEVPRVSVDEAQVDRVIEQLQQKHAEIGDKTGELAAGDIAVLAWTATVDELPMNDAAGEDMGQLAETKEYWVVIPKDGEEERFIPGFAPQLIGLAAGAEKTVTVTLPEHFQIEGLKGKEAVFAVTVKEAKERQLPPADDALAAKASEGKTMEELRETIRVGLTAEHDRMRANLVTNQILAFLNEKLEFELPQHLLFNETQRQVNDMVYESYQRGANEELIREHQNEILESAQVRARMNLKTTFILEKIAEAEGIRATDEEVSRRLMMIAANSGKPIKKVMKQIQENNGINRIRHDAAIAKVLDFLRGKAVVTEVDAPAEPVAAAAGEEN